MGAESGGCKRLGCGWNAEIAISALPAGVEEALIRTVSESIQSMPTFGKKKTVKQSGGGLIVLGIAGIIACLLAIAMVLTNMA